MRGREIALEDSLMNGFTRKLAAFEREHHAAAEDRVQKSEGVAHEQQAGRGAVTRVAAVFAGDEEVSSLRRTVDPGSECGGDQAAALGSSA
jgi:hypothetical protein